MERPRQDRRSGNRPAGGVPAQRDRQRGRVAECFSRWPKGYWLIAVDAFRGGTGPGLPGRRGLDDYADQVLAVVKHVGEPIHLVGFSWGGATALHMAATAPTVLASLAVIEPEAYSLLEADDEPAFTAIRNLCARWRAHTKAGDWHLALEEFIDFYNRPGSFAAWPAVTSSMPCIRPRPRTRRCTRGGPAGARCASRRRPPGGAPSVRP
jgi:pimeloyl-ACP methyl ester carboxylesterase